MQRRRQQDGISHCCAERLAVELVSDDDLLINVLPSVKPADLADMSAAVLRNVALFRRSGATKQCHLLQLKYLLAMDPSDCRSGGVCRSSIGACLNPI